MVHVNRTVVGEDGRVQGLADREITAQHVGLSPETIRKRCTPVEYDEETGRALYDVAAVREQLQAADARPRPEMRGRRRPAWERARRRR